MELTWAGKRKAIVITIFSLVGLTLLSGLGFAIFYKVPSCTDGKLNQDEVGIDCGGSCTTFCSSEVKPIKVDFVRALQTEQGRVDVIAYLENPNKDAAAQSVEATVDLFGPNSTPISSKKITIDIAPGVTTPVFIPGILGREEQIVQTFLTIDASSFVWFKAPNTTSVTPTVDTIVTEETGTPRVRAVLHNPTAYTISNTTLVATVFDTSGKAMAASKTLVPTLPPQGTSPLIFTWNAPFPGQVGRVEIIPLSVVTR